MAAPRLILAVMDIQEVRGLFGRLERATEFSREEAIQVARQAIRITRERTATGVDSRHRTFVPYTEAYHRQRLRAGRSIVPVTLRLKGAGSMMNHLRPYATTIQGHVTAKMAFNDNEERIKAMTHNFGGGNNIPQREFLGFVRGTPSYSELSRFVRSIVVDKVKEAKRRNTRRGGY